MRECDIDAGHRDQRRLASRWAFSFVSCDGGTVIYDLSYSLDEICDLR